MLNLDIRDFEFWLREAKKKTLREKIYDLRISRMAWAESDPVKHEMRIYQDALEKLEGTGTKRYAKTWTEAMGKSKG